LDLKLLGSIIFGIRPSSPKVERILIEEVKRRFKYRYPESKIAKRGPPGTIWYIVQASWWKRWENHVAKGSNLDTNLSKIGNNELLVDNGSLALRSELRHKHDFEVC
jgi:hypothetical protein